MGFLNFGEAKETHDQIASGNQPELTHELLGGAAAFAGMKMWEKQQREKGEPVEHARAKEMLAALAGAAVDRLAETKGADAVDHYKAKKHAEEQAMRFYDESYGGKEQWHPDHEAPREFEL